MQPLTEPRPSGSGSAVETVLLRKTFGKITALDNLTLSLPYGCVFGLLGPNGAGKSTFVRMLATLLAPTSGTARINGHDLLKSPGAVRRSIGFIPQAHTSDLELTGAENLNYYAGLFEVPLRERQSLINELLDWMGLLDARDRLVRAYSGGMRRRLEIARCLIHRPATLLLDEPTGGLDPAAQRAMWQTLLRLREERRLTVILTTHQMVEAERICERVAILDRGRVVAHGSPRELKVAAGLETGTLEDVYLHYTDRQ